MFSFDPAVLVLVFSQK